MTYFGQRTFKGLYSVSKQLLEANGSYRFGGTHGQIAYNAATKELVDVTLHHSGVNVVNTIADTVVVSLIGIVRDIPAVFTDVTLVQLDGTEYTLPEDKHAILLEGLVHANGAAYEDNDLRRFDPGTVINSVEPHGLLLVFGFSQTYPQ